MTVKNMLKNLNWVYLAAMLIALVLATTRYGLSSVWQTIIVLFCIVQLIFNLATIYSILKNRLEDKRWIFSRSQIVTIILSSIIVGVFFVYVLTDYFRMFVLTYSGVIIAMLLIYDLGKMILKRIR